MKNPSEQFNPYPKEQEGEKFASELLDDKESFPPPAEMLRPGEKVQAIEEQEVRAAVEQAVSQGSLSKKAAEFLHTWGLRALVLMTLMSSGTKHVEDPENEKIENLAENMHVTLPEVVVYGHRDKETDELMNYLSSKEPLSEKKQHELEAEVFLQRVRSVCRAYEDSSPEIKDTMFSSHFKKFVEYITPKLEMLRKGDLGVYRESVEFNKDYLEYKFATIPTRVFKSSPTEADNLQSKLDYFRIYYAYCGPVEFDEVYKHTKNLSDEEIMQRLIKEMPNFSELSKSNFSVEQYDAVWSMHQQHGNPKVRTSENFTPAYSNGSRAYYMPSENEIYLGINSGFAPLRLDDWLAELAHSEQYVVKYSEEEIEEMNEKERAFLQLMAIEETKNTGKLYNVDNNWGELRDKYLYSKPGSIEHEAHKVIEPLLQKELEEKMKSKK